MGEVCSVAITRMTSKLIWIRNFIPIFISGMSSQDNHLSPKQTYHHPKNNIMASYMNQNEGAANQKTPKPTFPTILPKNRW